MEPDPFSFHLSAADIKHELVNLNQLVFEVTDSCNLRCRYCVFGEFYSGFDHPTHQFMPFSEAKAVIDYLSELWNENASAAACSRLTVSFYGGEPLLNVPLIKDVINYLHSIQIPKTLAFAMTSNCMLLDRHMDFLVENDFHLLCSLDGDSQSDAYRICQDGSPSFNRVFGNIKLLQARYPSYFATNVEFNSVLHNLNNVPDLWAFFKREFGKVPLISELNSIGIREDQKEVFMKTFRDMRESLNSAENREELTKELGFDAPDANELMFYFMSKGNVFENYNDLLSPDTDVPRMPTGTCLPFSRKMFVKVDGKILPCERIHHNFYSGVVKEGKVELDFDEIADTFNSYLNKVKPLCRVCAGMKHCGRCFYNINGIDSEPFVCDSFMTHSQIQRQEKHYLNYLYYHPDLYKKFMNDVALD